MDLLVGLAWVAAAGALWPRRAPALLTAAVGVTWLAGSLDPALALLHRGALAHLLVAYPAGRLASSTTRVAVAAAYVSALLAGGPAFAMLLAAACALRYLRSTGVVRRSRLIPLIVAVATGLAGVRLDAYEVTLLIAAVAVVVDLRTARWSAGSFTGLVVDLGRARPHGALRDRLARALGDPTLSVAYLVDGVPVDEFGRAVEVPRDGRAVTAVGSALLIHDPATDRALLARAAAVTDVAATNARLQADVRARVVEVRASTRRLLDVVEAERRRAGAELRARIDPLLAAAAVELDGDLLARLDLVRAQLHALAAGLDPLHGVGLEPALRELAEGLPATVSVPPERFAPAVEACVWFTCSEAIANALKHAGPAQLDITVTHDGSRLRAAVSDDGVGGADPRRGTGLRRLSERVEAAGGEFTIDSAPGRGTRLTLEIAA